MRHLAAYMLAKMGGCERPQVADLENIMSSVGIVCDKEQAQIVIDQLEGKDLQQVIEDGKEKLAMLTPTVGVTALPPQQADQENALTNDDPKPGDDDDDDDDDDSDMGLNLFGD